MQLKVVTASRREGKNNETGKPYNFLAIGGTMTTANGTEYVEVILDRDHQMPNVGQVYEVELSFYPDREKKLRFRTEGLRAVLPSGKVA